GAITPVDDQSELEMLHHSRRRLGEAGYHAYEISNYARNGEECRHNLLYWNGGSYVGLGPSAASHVRGWRWKNRPHLSEWESAVEPGAGPTADVEHLSPAQRAGELIMLQLRLAQGVQFADVTALTGIDPRLQYDQTLSRLENLGLLWISNTGCGLTEKG